MVMGKVIEYYVPEKFTPQQAKWMPEADRGKLIGFQCKTAVQAEAQPASASRWMAFTPR